MAAAALAMAVLGAGARPAAADSHKPYWLVSFMGGVFDPLGRTADTRDIGLAVAARLGYTGASGLGLAVSVDYSPLPVAKAAVAPGRAIIDNHFVAVALAPRFTLGHGSFRMWLSGGGGLVVERTTTDTAVDSSVEPAASGELGLEAYFTDSGGLVLSGGYLRSFGDRRSQMATVLGGLVFSFR